MTGEWGYKNYFHRGIRKFMMRSLEREQVHAGADGVYLPVRKSSG